MIKSCTAIFLLSAVPVFQGALDEMNIRFNEVSGSVEIAYTMKTETKQEMLTLQRSKDKVNWNDLSSQKITRKNAGSVKSFSFTDRNPSTGTMYYRFKINCSGDKWIFSPVGSIQLNNPKNTWVLYPNPVQDVLSIQYKGVESIKGVINLFVYNSLGNIIARKRFSSNQRLLSLQVDYLTRGTYFIRIYVQDEMLAFEKFTRI